jgi:hypothetical protein
MSRLRIEKIRGAITNEWFVEPLGVGSGNWGERDSKDSGAHMSALPSHLAEKVALLYACDNDTELPGVGYRVSQNVFYVEE